MNKLCKLTCGTMLHLDISLDQNESKSNEDTYKKLYMALNSLKSNDLSSFLSQSLNERFTSLLNSVLLMSMLKCLGPFFFSSLNCEQFRQNTCISLNTITDRCGY